MLSNIAEKTQVKVRVWFQRTPGVSCSNVKIQTNTSKYQPFHKSFFEYVRKLYVEHEQYIFSHKHIYKQILDLSVTAISCMDILLPSSMAKVSEPKLIPSSICLHSLHSPEALFFYWEQREIPSTSRNGKVMTHSPSSQVTVLVLCDWPSALTEEDTLELTQYTLSCLPTPEWSREGVKERYVLLKRWKVEYICCFALHRQRIHLP